MLLQFDSEVVLLFLRVSLSHQIVPNPNLALKNEVHVGHFVFFVQNEPVFQLHIEFGWFESKANFKKEVFVVNLVDLVSGNEKGSKSENDIVEQVVQQDMVLDLLRALVQVLVVNLHVVESILSPEVRKMPVNLVDKHSR